MCKYCELHTELESIGEKSNGWTELTAIKDGSYISTILLYRYIVESDNHRCNELVIESAVKIGNDVLTVQTEAIPIKYCPFCGEEL